MASSNAGTGGAGNTMSEVVASRAQQQYIKWAISEAQRIAMQMNTSGVGGLSLGAQALGIGQGPLSAPNTQQQTLKDRLQDITLKRSVQARVADKLLSVVNMDIFHDDPQGKLIFEAIMHAAIGRLEQ